MVARSQAQPNAGCAKVCCNKAVFNRSTLRTDCQNDSQESCPTIANRGICRRRFIIGHENSLSINTGPLHGCESAETSSVSCPKKQHPGSVRSPRKICERE